MDKFHPRQALAIACLQWVATTAAAQTAPEVELPAIDVVANSIVTGAALTDVPANAQIIKKDAIAAQGITNLGDLLNNSLGSVSVSNAAGNPYQNDVSYRGFQATSLLGAPVGLSVYMDGVRMNEAFGSIVNWDLIPMGAIADVNVLPGSNPMFGLNTLGGALVVNTKNGKDDAGTAFSVLGGSFRRRAANVESGWTDDAHGTDYFFTANYDRQNGYRWHSGSEVQQLYGKARWHDATTKAELSFALADNTMSGTQSLPADMLANPAAPYTYPDTIKNRMALLNLKLSQAVGDDDLVVGNIYFRRSNATSVNSNAQLSDGCAATPGCAAAIWTAPGTARSVNGSYTSEVHTTLVQSQTRQDTVGMNLMWSNFDRIAGHDNTLNLGASSDFSRIAYAQNTSLAQMINYQAVMQPYNLQYGAGYSPLQNSVAVGAHNTDFSLYLFDTFGLTDKLKLTAAGSFNLSMVSLQGVNQQFLNVDGSYSWTDNATGIDYYNPDYSGVTGFTPTGTAGPQTSPLDGSHRFHRFNPALGFSYLATDNLNLFGGYSESMRAPTAIELACADPARPCALPTGFNGDPPLQAVIAKTFELGARGKWSTGTRWNAAAYDTRLQNDIQFQLSSTALGYFANVGATERRGIDLGLAQQISQLSLSANYGYVSAIYKSAWTNTAGDAVASGNRIPGIPAQTLKLRSLYQFSPRFGAGATLVLAQGQYAHGDESNHYQKVPGYGVANLDLHYRISDELTLTGIVNNVLDKQYYTYGVMGTSIYSGQFGQMMTPAAPRAIWVGLTYTFGGKRLNKVDKD